MGSKYCLYHMPPRNTRAIFDSVRKSLLRQCNVLIKITIKMRSAMGSTRQVVDASSFTSCVVYVSQNNYKQKTSAIDRAVDTQFLQAARSMNSKQKSRRKRSLLISATVSRTRTVTAATNAAATLANVDPSLAASSVAPAGAGNCARAR